MGLALSRTFEAFFRSEKSGGVLLAACTAAALGIANSSLGPAFAGFWQVTLLGMSLGHWVNDGLMAVFFLLIGLELEREVYNGELSDVRNAILPVIAAVGGFGVPALFHFALNAGTGTQAGAGIPMATDIAFALGVLAVLGSRVPASLKVFLTALAVADDLGAIVVIAVFYSGAVSVALLGGALLVFAGLCALNRIARVHALWPYLLGGAAMWFLLLRSGVHPTLAGVMLAFAIPYSSRAEDEHSPSHRLEHALHRPVAYVVLPLFALANTGVALAGDWQSSLADANSLGIAAGLVLGKPLGIVGLSYLAVAAGVCRLPAELGWAHVAGAGALGGIGFTMSIFIANLAFAGQPAHIDASKLAILVASCVAGTAGYAWLRFAVPTAGAAPRSAAG
jgi:NhaA family Na+:H+ antiporter